jgi:hypothetical protein
MHGSQWVFLGIVGALAVACASAGSRSGSKSSCRLSQQDSTYLARGPVYRDCAVDKKAALVTTNVHPQFQPTGAERGCLAADVEFVVDTLGVPELGTSRLVRATTSSFGEAVVGMVPSLRYEPARVADHRVRQIVSMHQAAILSRVVVPAGSGPPTRSGATSPMPTC